MCNSSSLSLPEGTGQTAAAVLMGNTQEDLLKNIPSSFWKKKSKSDDKVCCYTLLCIKKQLKIMDLDKMFFFLS